jgi:formylglycine-generating enzyme required for sulfatase activity
MTTTTRANNAGSVAIWIVTVLVLSAFIVAGIWWFVLNKSNVQPQIDSLKSQVAQIEAKYKAVGTLSEQDKTTLENLKTSVKDLQNSTANLSQDAKIDIASLTDRIDTLDGIVGRTGPQGAQGSQGVQGPQGLQGIQGIQGSSGSNNCILGVCVSRQATIGSPEIGNINITGNVMSATLQGNGANVTNVDAITLQGNTANYFTNASNLTSGTINTARLDTSVTLQGNTFNGINQLVQLNGSGELPVLSGVNLTNINASTLQGNNSSYFTNATNLVSGTVADVRLSTNIALLNANQTFVGTMLISTAGTALTVTNAASIGTLTVVNGAGIGGSLAVTGGITGSSLSVTNTVTAASYAKSCPTGYVPVPGNSKFGTSDFCVMKYEAKDDGSGNAVSTAAGTPLVNISQRTAEDKSIAAGGHLITEAEWMTIATNALWVDANWCNLDGTSCGNAPGTSGKYLATGHQDNSPSAALAATSNDSDACYGTVTAGVSTACGAVGTQKRTLTLSNGSVIWDIPGNVWEWTDSWALGGDQPTTTSPGFNWRDFSAITKWQAFNYINPTNRGWNSTQRLGQIYSSGVATDTALYGFLRGGSWTDGIESGALALALGYAPTGTNVGFGFRVAR